MAYTTIDKPDLYFNTVLYTGDGTAIGSGGQAITGVGFAPDLTWIKERSSTSPHKLLDTVRGATKELESSSNVQEFSTAESLASFDSDGFTVGNNGAVNQSSQTYVSWNWLANGTGVSNTDGDITSTVSANTTSGFSIVSFIGNGGSDQQVGHGLGTTPTLYITKDRTNGSTNWHYHTTQIDGGMDFGKLNLTDAFASSSLSAPSSTTIRVGGTINTSSANFISYVFAEKKGFSKFGSYTGNGNADGSFVYCGFKPAFIITKSATSLEHWYMNDSKRSLNGADKKLFPNLNSAESSEVNSDILSNGFKLRSSNAIHNSSGQTYIYMCFAESPFTTSTGIPTTAR